MSIGFEARKLVSELSQVPTIDIGMETSHCIADKLFKILQGEEDIKKGLVNMFLLGQIFHDI